MSSRTRQWIFICLLISPCHSFGALGMQSLMHHVLDVARATRQAPSDSEIEYSRLLSTGVFMNRFVQFNLTTGQKSNFPLESQNVNDIVFDEDSMNIIFGNGSFHDLGDSGIFSVHLEGGTPTPLRMGFVASGLAIDKGRQLLFFSILRPQRSISVMGLQGDDYRLLHEINYMGWHVYSVALDTVRQKVYWCQEFRFVKMDYSGANVEQISRGAWIHAVTLDPTGDVLYFNVNKKLMKLDLETQEVTVEKNIRAILWRMVYHDHVIYMGFWETYAIKKLNLTSRSFSLLGGGIDSNYGSVCLIP